MLKYNIITKQKMRKFEPIKVDRTNTTTPSSRAKAFVILCLCLEFIRTVNLHRTS